MDRPEIFKKLNDAARNGDVFSALRQLPIDVVGDALLDIPDDYPAARAALPRMAADEIQDFWTGKHGHPLLFESCAFVRSIESGFLKYSCRRLENTRILDYGCGWGRLIRLMYAFTSPENIYGCDPWDRSINICKDYGIKANLAICDYLPKAVPFENVKFDLIYAFSVFTHLSESTSKTVLSALRKALAKDGLLAITIRPDSYWYVHDSSATKVDLHLMHEVHAHGKYAFAPHFPHASSMTDADGLNTYGDASFSLDYIADNWTDWKVVGTDINLVDPHQTVVFLKPNI